MRSRLLLLVALVGILVGCDTSGSAHTASSSPVNATPLDLLSVHTTSFHLGPWPTAAGPMPKAEAGPRDSTGVRMVARNGVLYNAPVMQAQDGLGALLVYVANKNKTYLKLAEKEGQRLIDTHMTNPATGDAWWFAYPFNYALYQDPQDTTIAPWYSGMAQGEAVYLFTRLYEITHNSTWKNAALHAFDALLYPYKAGESPTARPWGSAVDSNGYFWIEEWTTPKPFDDTLNGFGFALYGVIEYEREFHDARALRMADAALTTYLYAAQIARHPGGPSSYRLSHPLKRYTGYHHIVTAQLQTFGYVTGDAQFTTLAQEFHQDYP